MPIEICKICGGKSHSLPYCIWQTIKLLTEDVAAAVKLKLDIDVNVCELCHRTGHKRLCSLCPYYSKLSNDTQKYGCAKGTSVEEALELCSNIDKQEAKLCKRNNKKNEHDGKTRLVPSELSRLLPIEQTMIVYDEEE